MGQDRRQSQVWFWAAVATVVLVSIAIILTTLWSRPRPIEVITRSNALASVLATPFMTRFETGHDDAHWFIADFELTDHFVQSRWAVDHVAFADGEMTLKITDTPGETVPYSAAEYQKRGWYGHGRYEVVMRAARGSGLVSSFFTHTGAWFGDPHDEIDFEFLGEDTTRVHLNYYNNGQGGDGLIHDLSYDAADEFHLYAFEWTGETIRWFIDGVKIHEVPVNTQTKPPTTASRIMMNIWTGSPAQYEWHGEPDFESGASVAYRCVSFRPLGSHAEMCSSAPS